MNAFDISVNSDQFVFKLKRALLSFFRLSLVLLDEMLLSFLELSLTFLKMKECPLGLLFTERTTAWTPTSPFRIIF